MQRALSVLVAQQQLELLRKDRRIANLEAEVVRLSTRLSSSAVAPGPTASERQAETMRRSISRSALAGITRGCDVEHVLQHLLVLPWLGRSERAAFAMASAVSAMRNGERCVGAEEKRAGNEPATEVGSTECRELEDRLRALVESGDISTPALWSLLGEAQRARRSFVHDAPLTQLGESNHGGGYGGGGGGNEEDGASPEDSAGSGAAATGGPPGGSTKRRRKRRRKRKKATARLAAEGGMRPGELRGAPPPSAAREFGRYAPAVTRDALAYAAAARTRGRLERELVERRLALTRLGGASGCKGGGLSLTDLAAHNKWLLGEEAKLQAERDTLVAASSAGGGGGGGAVERSAGGRRRIASALGRNMAAQERFNTKLSLFRAEAEWFRTSPAFARAQAHVRSHYSPVGASQTWLANTPGEGGAGAGEREVEDFEAMLARLKAEDAR
jgi:hypothetical protein